MASISTDRYGNRTVQFIAADAKQRSIRLGKMPLKAVRAIKTKVEALNAAAIAGSSWEYQTSEWVGERDAVLYDKLAGVRLVPKRPEAEHVGLAPFIDAYMERRADLKPTNQDEIADYT